MPVSWELKAQRRVLSYSIHVESTTMRWAAAFRRLIIPGDFFFVPSGMPFDHARNTAVQQFLNSPYEYLFSLDSDVCPPPDTILRLLAHNRPFISGMYCRRSPPKSVPVMIKNGSWVTNFVKGSLVEVDLVGAGCLLIHRSVFERVPPLRPGKPWYDWRVDLRGSGVVPEDSCLSEDFVHNWWLRKHGIQMWVDTGVTCKHVGLAESDLGTFEPLAPA